MSSALNPTYNKVITPEQARYIERAISGGYHERNDYPKLLVSAQDRHTYHQYVVRVLKDLTSGGL